MNPRLLLIGNFLSAATGVRSVSEDLALQLTQAGWSVLTTSARAGRVARAADMLLTVWHRQRDYELAHVEVYSGPAFRWAEWTSQTLQKLRKPFLLTLHGGNLPSFAAQHPQRVRKLLQSAQQVTAPSRFLLEALRPYRADLLLLPNPLHIRAYEFRRREQAAPHLIWLRAFHQIYNPTLAVRVLARLRAEFPDIHLTMIGPDKGDGSFQATQQTIAKLGLSDAVELPGAVPKTEIASWLNRGDVFLNTAKIDNTPVSVLEALACGLCVVSTNIGGLPYLLDHEVDALLTEPDDVEAMVEAVRRVLNNRALAARLSLNARQKAEAYDWAHVLPRWETLLRHTGQTS
jgi:glycosyltransferase involved in cell wall biosynthesis